MKKVMAFGTFDIFHRGHIDFLKQARQCGDYLIVVVARDETVLKVKKKEARNDEQKRLNILKEGGLADEVVLGSKGNKYAVIENIKPDVICLGYDQEFFIDKLRDKLDEFGLDKTEIVRLRSFKPDKYKSSKLENV